MFIVESYVDIRNFRYRQLGQIIISAKMLFTKFIALFRNSSKPRLHWEDELYSPQKLDLLLRRERSRADRTNDEFSLLKLSSRDSDTSDLTLECLVKILRGRLRCTDEIGWLERGTIGVVLPSTPSQGAVRVCDDIFREFPTDLIPPHCEIYTYPFHWKNVPKEKSDLIESDRDSSRSVQPMDLLFCQKNPLWKRTIDVVAAMLGLVLLSPVLVGIAICIRLFMGRPVLFTQKRAGLAGRPFRMFKFRSMVADAEQQQSELRTMNEQDGPAFKIEDDPRVTRLGRILRRTSLDELPQLWNVLRGEMSLVGPRPLPCEESEGCSGWHLERLDVTPGLTCIWQVRGRSEVTFDKWMRMDLQYVRARSLIHDLKLLILTIPAVLMRKGAK